MAGVRLITLQACLGKSGQVQISSGWLTLEASSWRQHIIQFTVWMLTMRFPTSGRLKEGIAD